MVKAWDLDTIKTLKDFSPSYIILYNMSSFMVNLLCTKGMCTVLCIHFQYASCFSRLFMSHASVSSVSFSKKKPLVMETGGNSSNNVLQIPVL